MCYFCSIFNDKFSKIIINRNKNKISYLHDFDFRLHDTIFNFDCISSKQVKLIKQMKRHQVFIHSDVLFMNIITGKTLPRNMVEHYKIKFLKCNQKFIKIIFHKTSK